MGTYTVSVKRLGIHTGVGGSKSSLLAQCIRTIDFLLQLQIIIYDKDNIFFKEASIQILKLLNDIYFTVLNIVSLLIKK
jgi:hypothetical protein